MEQSASQTCNSRVSPPLPCCNAGAGAAKIYQWYKRTLSDAASSTLRLSRCAELSRVRAARSQLARLGCGEGGSGVRTAGEPDGRERRLPVGGRVAKPRRGHHPAQGYEARPTLLLAPESNEAAPGLQI